MDALSLQDKLARGMGTAARKIGLPTAVYRPCGPIQPITAKRKVITISAAFEAKRQTSGSGGVASPFWNGIFDALYTRPADYLVSPEGTFFVANQTPGKPTICVLTNRVATVCRSTFVPQGGYSGFSASESEIALEKWPASLIQAGGGSVATGAEFHPLGTWTLLLPTLPLPVSSSEMISDDLGATYVVDTAEQNWLGWRLRIRQIGA